MKRLLLTSVSVLALSSATYAADLSVPTKAPTIAPPSWEGFYLGIDGGVTRHDGYFNDLSNGLAAQVGVSGTSFSTSQTGGVAGGFAGYSWQQRSFVYGVEADINWVGAKATENWGNNGVFNGSIQQSQNISWLATFRARAGIDFESTLFYLTGGLAVAGVKDSFNASCGPFGFGCFGAPHGSFVGGFSENTTRLGWTAGAGFEHMFDAHWTVRGEFRYADLGRSSALSCVAVALAAGVCGPPSTNYRGEFSNTLMTGLVGLGYKF